MIKRNNLRKVYAAYWIIIGELFCISFIIGSAYIVPDTLRSIIQIFGIIGVVFIPVITYLFYRWLKKDNATASDELEQMVLLKAFALTGLVSLSLIPFLLLLSCIFSQVAGYLVFGYTVIIGGTFKTTTFILYKKY